MASWPQFQGQRRPETKGIPLFYSLLKPPTLSLPHTQTSHSLPPSQFTHLLSTQTSHSLPPPQFTHSSAVHMYNHVHVYIYTQHLVQLWVRFAQCSLEVREGLSVDSTSLQQQPQSQMDLTRPREGGGEREHPLVRLLRPAIATQEVWVYESMGV